MKRIFAILLIVLLLGACSRQVRDGEPTSESETSSEPATTSEPATSPVFSTVRLISNGAEHEPYEQMLYSTSYYNGQLIDADADIRLDKTEALQEIVYADDFQIVLSGNYAAYEVTVQCALYENDYESIWAVYRNAIGSDPKSIEDFTFPDEAGLYLLNVEMSWRRGEEGACYAHVFKIRK